MRSQTFESKREDLAADVSTAEKAIVDAMTQRPAEHWTPRGLRSIAAADLTPAVVSIALARLVGEHKLVIDDDLSVRLAGSDPLQGT